MFTTRFYLAMTLVIMFVLVALSAPFAASADAPSRDDVAALRLAQEPALACVAFETGLSAEMVALAKVQFDIEFGFAHGIATVDQWGATFGDRMQFFTDALGVPNPTRDGAPLAWCGRLLNARQKILAAWKP